MWPRRLQSRQILAAPSKAALPQINAWNVYCQTDKASSGLVRWIGYYVNINIKLRQIGKYNTRFCWAEVPAASQHFVLYIASSLENSTQRGVALLSKDFHKALPFLHTIPLDFVERHNDHRPIDDSSPTLTSSCSLMMHTSDS